MKEYQQIATAITKNYNIKYVMKKCGKTQICWVLATHVLLKKKEVKKMQRSEDFYNRLEDLFSGEISRWSLGFKGSTDFYCIEYSWIWVL